MKHALPLALFALLLAACGGGRYHGPTAYDLHGQRGAMRPGGDYIVRPGDTLFGISWRYGLDMQELANWNGISDPNRILVGQRLRLIQRLAVPPPALHPQIGRLTGTRQRLIGHPATLTALMNGGLRLPGKTRSQHDHQPHHGQAGHEHPPPGQVGFPDQGRSRCDEATEHQHCQAASREAETEPPHVNPGAAAGWQRLCAR